MRRAGIGWGRVRVGVRRSQAVWGVWVLWGATLACGPDAAEIRGEDPRPNVLLISLDTVRADHLSVYGHERDTSPSLRSLASQGVLFETAYAPSATTGPSHASLFTSLPPVSHGVLKNGHDLDPAWTTLAEALSRAGYETAAVVSSYVLASRFGYDQGFDLFDEDFSLAEVPSGVTLWEGEEVEGKFHGRADDTTRRALNWLSERSQPEHPFFLFVHYFDAHDPYTPPPDYPLPFQPGPKESLKRNRTIFLYDVLLAYLDQEVGRLLAALPELGLEENTLVVVTGDHGEGLMQHGVWHHGLHIYEEGVRIPLILRLPGSLPAGRRIESPVSLLDLAPSLLALTQSPGESGFEGSNLAGVLTGTKTMAPDRPIWLYRRIYASGDEVEGVSAQGEQWGLRRGRWKLIVGEAEDQLELYDLASDPQETINLADQRDEVVTKLRAELDQWLREHPRPRGVPAAMDPEVSRRLEALGYVE